MSIARFSRTVGEPSPRSCRAQSRDLLRAQRSRHALRLRPGRTGIVVAALLLAACGKQQVLHPPVGVPLPPKPATSPVQPDATALLLAPAPFRPSRSDELLTKSETRPDDRFDLPPH